MRRVLLALATGLSLCLPAGSVVGQTPGGSIAELVDIANTGNAEAQFALAERYHDGDGVLQSYANAAEWYTHAAQAGHATAQNQLGKYYHTGLGVKRDQATALHWLEAAAKQGNAGHVFDLGVALENGADGSTDPTRAAQLFAQAAEAGHADAAVSLGVLYQNGSGVPQDYARALALYQGPAAEGHARAQNNLGLLYVRATGVEQDYERAVGLFEAAAEQGLTTAMTNLGVMYENGFGVEHSDVIAAELYRRAGQTGQADLEKAPTFVFDQRLITPDGTEAEAKTTILAAQAGDPVAQFLLGWLLVTQAEPPQSAYRQAAQLFESAAKKGHAASMANLGLLYFQGRGLPQDFVLGQMWLVLADTAGLDGAAGLGATMSQKMTPVQINEAQSRAEAIWQSMQPN